jgi:hypothetical protein
LFVKHTGAAQRWQAIHF